MVDKCVKEVRNSFVVIVVDAYDIHFFTTLLTDRLSFFSFLSFLSPPISQCVTSFKSKKLDSSETACVENCGAKFLAAQARVGQR